MIYAAELRGKTRERAREFLAARENQRKEEEGEKPREPLGRGRRSMMT